MSHRTHDIIYTVAAAIENGTATVDFAPHGVVIEGKDHCGQPFHLLTREDGRMILSPDEGGPTVEEAADVPIPE